MSRVGEAMPVTKKPGEHRDRGLHQSERLSADQSHSRGHRHHPLSDRQTGGGGADFKGASVSSASALTACLNNSF